MRSIAVLPNKGSEMYIHRERLPANGKAIRAVLRPDQMDILIAPEACEENTGLQCTRAACDVDQRMRIPRVVELVSFQVAEDQLGLFVRGMRDLDVFFRIEA